MDGTLLISKRTYSLSKKAPITEWIELPFNISSIKMPKDFEIRLVNANLKMKSLYTEFPELILSWRDHDQINTLVKKYIPFYDGLTDVVWYCNSLKLAFIQSAHRDSNKLENLLSINAVKEFLINDTK